MISTRAPVEREGVADLCLAMAGIPSPTGHERELAEWIAARLQTGGFEVELQVFDETRANVVGRRRGLGGGPTLMLYSPIDTAFPLPGDAASGALGDPVPPTLADGAVRSGDWIVGSGAENPKGFGASVIAAAETIAASDQALPGDLVVALTAGGMPSLGDRERPGSRGLGAGCRVLLDRMPAPDHAIIAKPGDAVSWGEVGIAFFRIRLTGDLGYTGTQHLADSREALADGVRLADRLGHWFPGYTAERMTETFAPQGAVTAIRSGWPDRPAFLAATCDLFVDLRVVPGETLDAVEAALATAVREASAGLDSTVTVVRLGGFEGAVTDPTSWIVRSLIAAWESRSGRPHVPRTGGSGVTDASLLRAAGIPTARIGMPRQPEPSPYPGFSLGAVHLDGMVALAETLADAVLDTCGRTVAEIARLDAEAGTARAGATGATGTIGVVGATATTGTTGTTGPTDAPGGARP